MIICQTVMFFLNSMIDERIILEMQRSLDLIVRQMLHHKEKIHDQLLLNEYYDTKIMNKIEIADNELGSYLNIIRPDYMSAYLYAPDLETIKDMAGQIRSGVSWDSLARICFEDSILKNNGGDLGWYKMGELDPAFEITAFELSDGEISEPVKTSNGFSLIQVLERKKISSSRSRIIN